ncbi:angiopoietin-related protein 7-like [Anopheles ziemanni]|uniref:angiopoietin-related protein 7-like n=1 Tax=Anopheles coustani TaxID=139045 RepID=UPI002659C549|nr:angiopoietin-related protein 7-like [Anopheles coustani]XP_058167185.1 angiopoietin-related protein 7-like [Anopheles ziemanni]
MSEKNDILLQKMEQHLQEKMEQMDSKFETKLHAMEEFMKKSVKTSEDNIRAKFENISNQLIFKMENILQQQEAETKTFQETSKTHLQKIGENKNALDMLSGTVRIMSTLTEGSNKILEAHFVYPVLSCQDVMKLSGRYVIHVGQNLQPLKVLCEQNKFDGGWTVIQQRYDGSVDFYRNWTEYRNGFGALDGEFWLGLEYLHQMTTNRPHELMVEVKDFHGNYGYAKYEEFEIGNESEKYVLKKLGLYSGTAGNSMQYNKNEKFSTFDRNNDRFGNKCAEERHGAWWYYGCTNSNLNGRYQNTIDDRSAIEWWYFKNDFREVKDFHGNYGYAKYDEFEIGSESEEYKLKKLGTYSGTAGDPLQYQKNQKFTTFDRDNDQSNSVNCAEEHHGAWWYWGCTISNLNGRYENSTGDSLMTWYYLKNDLRGMSYSRMMIRDIIN